MWFQETTPPNAKRNNTRKGGRETKNVAAYILQKCIADTQKLVIVIKAIDVIIMQPGGRKYQKS